MSFHSFIFKSFSQVIHFNSFMSIRSCPFLHFNSFIHLSIHSSFDSFMSIHSCQFIHFNSFISIHSFQFMRFNSFTYFNWFMLSHSCPLLSNPPRIPTSHVPFSKLPPPRVPGTSLYLICQYIMIYYVSNLYIWYSHVLGVWAIVAAKGDEVPTSISTYFHSNVLIKVFQRHNFPRSGGSSCGSNSRVRNLMYLHSWVCHGTRCPNKSTLPSKSKESGKWLVTCGY